MDARVPDGRLTGRYPLPPSRVVLRSLSVASEVQASCTHEHRVLTAFVRTKCSCGGRADRVDVGLTGILVRLLRLLSSSNCHCLIQKNSNQPAAKSAFVLEFSGILRGPDAAILDCLFRASTIRKNSTRYQARQTLLASDTRIHLCP